MIISNPRKKIIYYTLSHCNNSRLNVDCRMITNMCPVYWVETNQWTNKEFTVNWYRCSINYIVYQDSDILNPETI